MPCLCQNEAIRARKQFQFHFRVAYILGTLGQMCYGYGSQKSTPNSTQSVWIMPPQFHAMGEDNANLFYFMNED